MQTVGIVGLGALGVLFGQRLLENGADVRVIADEARAERYQKQGVICNDTPVNFRYETPKTAKPVDLMIFATKESGLRGAMETASGFIGENTLMLSVLNGVSSEETIAARFGEQNVIYCTAQGMDAVKVGNALTYAHAGMIVLGEKQPSGISPRVRQIADFLNTHGVTAQPVGDMVRRQWGKLMLNVGINQTVMVFEGDYGTVQKPGKPREIMLAAMREVQMLDLFCTGNGNNDGKFSNADFDAAMKKAASTMDTAERSAALHEAEDVLMEQVGCIPVAYYNDFWLQSEKITGIWHSAYGYWYFMYGDIAE